MNDNSGTLRLNPQPSLIYMIDRHVTLLLVDLHWIRTSDSEKIQYTCCVWCSTVVSMFLPTYTCLSTAFRFHNQTGGLSSVEMLIYLRRHYFYRCRTSDLEPWLNYSWNSFLQQHGLLTELFHILIINKYSRIDVNLLDVNIEVLLWKFGNCKWFCIVKVKVILLLY